MLQCSNNSHLKFFNFILSMRFWFLRISVRIETALWPVVLWILDVASLAVRFLLPASPRRFQVREWILQLIYTKTLARALLRTYYRPSCMSPGPSNHNFNISWRWCTNKHGFYSICAVRPDLHSCNLRWECFTIHRCCVDVCAPKPNWNI